MDHLDTDTTVALGGIAIDDFQIMACDGVAATATPTEDPTATNTPTNTPIITITPSNTPTATVTPSNTPTVIPNVTVGPTMIPVYLPLVGKGESAS